MPKHFCVCFSLRTGALILAFANLIGGLAEVIGGSVGITQETDKENTTIFVVCILSGLLAIFSGVILVIAIINAKEKLILLYILIGSTNFFIVTIYSGINMFQYKGLMLLFVLMVVLWYDQYCMYSFYEEIAAYNTVNSGPAEISYNTNGYTNNAITSESIDKSEV